MRDVAIYIDESGAHGFDFEKDGVTKFYVITPIVIPINKAQEFEGKLLEYFSKFSTGGRVKSSNLNSNPDRRLKILEGLNDLDFSFFSLIVDKTRIDMNTGLKYKPSFFKYFQNICYRRFVNTFDNIKIYSDKYGTEDFQNSFVTYIHRNYNVNNLFRDLDIQFVTGNLGTQLSDIIAGSIRVKFEGKLPYDVMSLLEKKSLFTISFPITRHYGTSIQGFVQENMSEDITDLSSRRALNFLKLKERSLTEEDTRAKIVLEMLYYKQYIFDTGYVSSHEIIRFLNEYYEIEINENDLRQTIIPYLRDNEVLISSSSKGYKLPSNIEDINDYIDITNKNTVKALKRLKKFIDSTQLKLGSDVRILDQPQYSTLKNLLELV